MSRIALLYGGRSTEHEVSVDSAKNIFQALIGSGFDVTCVGIAKDGTWHLQDPADTHDGLPGVVTRRDGDDVYVKPGLGLWDANGRLAIDAVLPVTHGTEGEDGRLQGLCDLAHLPCVGCDAPSSTVGMHKDMAKRLFSAVGIPVVPSIMLRREDMAWLADNDDATLPRFIESFIDRTITARPHTATREELLRITVAGTLGESVVVKPEAGGSSVGVTIVRDLDDPSEFDRTGRELLQAIATAAAVCDTVLIETLVSPMEEVECAVLETPDEGLVVGGPGMVCNPGQTESGFLSYEQKYGSNMPATMRIPAPIPWRTAQRIKDYATLAFRTIGANGYARVDFFVVKDTDAEPGQLRGQRIFLNEINTLPGMTKTSHYPRLIASQGYDMPTMIRTAIQEAIDRFDRLERLNHTL